MNSTGKLILIAVLFLATFCLLVETLPSNPQPEEGLIFSETLRSSAQGNWLLIEDTASG